MRMLSRTAAALYWLGRYVERADFTARLVEATVRLGYAIFTVATLSFIGFGIQPPSPDWGLSIATNYGLIGSGYWWTVLFDSLAIASLVTVSNVAVAVVTSLGLVG